GLGENSTGWPALTHNPPIAPPIWPEPMMPIRNLPPLACVKIRSGRSAASKADPPLAPSSARREQSKHPCFRIENSSRLRLSHYIHSLASETPPSSQMREMQLAT